MKRRIPHYLFRICLFLLFAGPVVRHEASAQELVYGGTLSGSLNSVYNVTAQETAPTGMTFDSNGSRVYIVGEGRTVYGYSLSTPYVVGSASYGSSSFSVANELNREVTDVAFNSNGTKMFVTGRKWNLITEINESFVVQYTIPTASAYDISTASSPVSLDVTSQESFIEGMAFNNDGSKLFIVGSGSDKVVEYSLSLAYDISTATLITSVAPGGDNNFTGIDFSSDGSRMYLTGSEFDRIREYHLSSPFDLTGGVTELGTYFTSGNSDPQGLIIGNSRFQTIGFDASTNATMQTYTRNTVVFEEGASNNGSVTGLATIYLTGGETFTNVGVAGGVDFSIDNLPSGLTASATAVTSNQVNVSISGTASDHQSYHSVDDLIFTFGNTAFTGGNATTVGKSGSANSGFKITFTDNPMLFYGTAYEKVSDITSPAPATMVSFTTSDDGTKIYLGALNSQIYGYHLAGAYDISTAPTYTNNLGLSTDDVYGIKFGDNGSKFLASKNTTRQYDLTIPYDLNSATLAHTGSYGQVRALSYSSDGTKLFLINWGTSVLKQYTLSTPFELSTLSTTSLKERKLPTDVYWDMQFSTAGDTLQLSSLAKTMYTFKLGSPFDIAGSFDLIDKTSVGTLSSNIGFKLSQDKSTLLLGVSTANKIEKWELRSKVFTESATNDGSVVGAYGINLLNDKFSKDSLIYGTHFTLNQVPAGLIPYIKVSSDSVSALLSFGGKASVPYSISNVDNLRITFLPAAFKSGSTTATFDFESISLGTGITFENGAFDITLSSSFTTTETYPFEIEASSEVPFNFKASDISISNGSVTQVTPNFQAQFKNGGGNSSFNDKRALSIEGHLLEIVNNTANMVVRDTSTYAAIQTITLTGAANPILFDIDVTDNGNIYLLDRQNEQVIILDAQYQEIRRFSTISQPAIMAVMHDGSKIVVASAASSPATIYDAVGNVHATSTFYAVDLAWHPSGYLFSLNGSQLRIFDPNSSYAQLHLESLPFSSNLIGIDRLGRVYISGNNSAYTQLQTYYFDQSTTTLTSLGIINPKTLSGATLSSDVITTIVATKSASILTGYGSYIALYQSGSTIKIMPTSTSNNVELQIAANTVAPYNQGTKSNNASNLISIDFNQDTPEVWISGSVPSGGTYDGEEVSLVISSSLDSLIELSDINLTGASFKEVSGSPVELRDGEAIASYGSGGAGANQFDQIWDIHFHDDTIFIADRLNDRIQLFDKEYNHLLSFTDGFNTVSGVHADDNHIYVADQENHRVRIYDRSLNLVNTLGTGSSGSSNATFNKPVGINTDSNGNIYVADQNNNRVQIFDQNLTYVATISNVLSVQDVEIVESKNLIIASSFGSERLQYYNLSDRSFLRNSTTITSSRKIALDDRGQVYAVNGSASNGRIYLLDDNGEIVKNFISGSFPVGVTFNSSGELMYTLYAGNKWYRSVPFRSLYTKIIPNDVNVTVDIAAGAVNDPFGQGNPAVNYAFTYQPPGNQWIGGASGAENDWNTGSNWSAGTVPTINDNVVIPATSNQPIVSGTVPVNDIFIQSGANLTIENEAGLAIMGTASGSGTVTAKRILRGSGSYNIIGSPMQNTAISSLNADFIYGYSGTSFNVPTEQSMTVGKGYFLAYMNAAPELMLTGTPNSGNQNISVSTTGDAFNAVANPYLAAIDRAAFVTANTGVIDGNIWLWNDGGQNAGTNRGGDYILVNNMGTASTINLNDGVPGSKLTLPTSTTPITSFQGFLVNATANGNVVFESTMQVTSAGSNGDGNFYRKAEENAYSTIKLSLSNSDHYNETLIGLVEGATYGHDYALDGAYRSVDDAFGFYTLMGDQPHAIQALPALETDEITVALEMKVPVEGAYTFKVEDLNQMDHVAIFLLDRQSGSKVRLNESSSIQLTIKTGATGRYAMLFTPSSLLANEDSSANLLVFSDDRHLMIWDEIEGEQLIRVTDLTGKTIIDQQVIFEKGQAVIPAILSRGHVYILHCAGRHTKFIVQ